VKERARTKKEYRKELEEALGSSFLRRTLDNFAAAYPASRAAALKGLDFDAMASEIAELRDEALPRLEELFDSFKDAAEKAGATVHRAKTAVEANEIIARIAREGGVTSIVKSKSMTAEETFLNDHLEAEGFRVTETDLGEWIIQLRGEGPSHMVMPAIHLSREEVARLFTEVTGTEQDPDDIEGLVRVARRELRAAFRDAEMGITGANFAVARTGTLGLVTNEGNARLATTLPRIHVALVGFEKLVPDMEAALRILTILPRSATGQAISSYVTWITGAVECRAATEGRKEQHIVFLDNGRLRLAGDPVFAQALRCIRCGACANVCPIYRLVGGHNFGHVYIGAIGLLLTLFYHDRERAAVLLENCLNCQACSKTCPAGIELPRLIQEARTAHLGMIDQKPIKNRLLSRVLLNRRLFHKLLRWASRLQKPVVRDGKIRYLPFLFNPRHRFRELPALAEKPLRDLWKGGKAAERKEGHRMRVGLFAGCLVDFVYPEQGEAFLRLLEGRDIHVDFPEEQTCCGLPARMMGEKETAGKVALHNVLAFDPDSYDWIVTLCASCGSYLKENIPLLIEEGAGIVEPPDELEERARRFAGKVIDFSSFMTNVLKVEPELFQADGKKAAYHAPCHLCRGLGKTREPRELLRTVGIEYVPVEDEEICCGFGGSWSIDFARMSAELLRLKLDRVEESGAGMVVTDCPGCVLQLRGGLLKRGSSVEAKHIAEAVADGLKNGEKPGPPAPDKD